MQDSIDNISIDNNSIDNNDRLLALEGGNNFRDLGGYTTVDNRRVKRGMVFRSGLMTGLTPQDQEMLGRIGIKTIVDFRSREELDLFPNHWAVTSGLNFVVHDYSMDDILVGRLDDAGGEMGMHIVYQRFTSLLKPQLTLLFQHLLDANTPLVFNCSAGQDRTGVASALILNTLGVPWQTILEDYHLSTRFRRPEIERAGVDLDAHAQTNAFAKWMLRYGEHDKKPEPLFTPDKVPYLHFAFAQMKESHGSVAQYMAAEVGVDAAAVERLKSSYLQ